MNENRDEYYQFLERLRRSGITNMYGAAPYLQTAFEDELTEKEANQILIDWMKHYTELDAKFHWQGWEDISGDEVNSEEPKDKEENSIFDEGIDKFEGESFINSLKELNPELVDDIKHICFIEDENLWVVNYNSGKTIFVEVLGDEPIVYEDLIDWCNENDREYEEVSQKIFDITHLDEPSSELESGEIEEPVLPDEYEFEESLDEEWSGLISARDILNNSDLNKEQAKELADYMNSSDSWTSGFRYKQEFIDYIDFDEEYKEWKEQEEADKQFELDNRDEVIGESIHKSSIDLFDLVDKIKNEIGYDYDILDVVNEKEIGSDIIYHELIKTVNDAKKFNYHSDYWGSDEEYKEQNVTAMTELKPYIDKKVTLNYDDGPKEEVILKGLLIDKQYNSIGHSKLLVEPFDVIVGEGLNETKAKPEGDKIYSFNKGLALAKKEGKPVIYGYTNGQHDGKFFEVDLIVCDDIRQCEKEFRNKYKNCEVVYVAYPDKDFISEGDK